MTTQELEALPINGGYVMRSATRNGVLQSWPEALPVCVLFTTPDDFVCIFDSSGLPWSTGKRADGVRMREAITLP